MRRLSRALVLESILSLLWGRGHSFKLGVCEWWSPLHALVDSRVVHVSLGAKAAPVATAIAVETQPHLHSYYRLCDLLLGVQHLVIKVDVVRAARSVRAYWAVVQALVAAVASRAARDEMPVARTCSWATTIRRRCPAAWCPHSATCSYLRGSRCTRVWSPCRRQHRRIRKSMSSCTIGTCSACVNGGEGG